MKAQNKDKRREPASLDYGWLVLLLLWCAGFTACYEPVEGCLDTNAVNFSLDADRPCDGCCTYPGLSIRLDHQWINEDTSFAFRYSSPAFSDGSGRPFGIERITYYLHDFELVDLNGAVVRTNDTVLVARLNDSGFYEDTFVRDDYLLINPAVASTTEVGTLIRNGTFTQLRFKLGVDEATDRILPGSLPDNHPLSLLDTSMYLLNDGRYLSNRMDLKRDTTPDAEELLLSYGAERPAGSVVVDIPGGFFLPAGFNMEVLLRVNYADWFAAVQGIDTAPAEMIEDQIVGELSNSFTLLDIRVNQR